MFDSGSNGAAYKVTGIIADPPKNAHFTFTMLASFKTAEVADPGILTVDGWGGSSYYTYLLLKKGVDHRAFSKKITTFYEKYVGAELAAIWKPIYTYYLQPLSAIHLRSRLQYEIAQTGNINHVYIFTTIGIFILLLAGINYVNLATARSVSRAKEVGIKKVVGAFKKQLIAQYLFEAIFTSLLALVASFIFCILLQPLFFQVTGKDLSLSSPGLIVFLAGITMLLGVLSGIYPAIIISGFKPVSVLKGAFKTGTKGVILRRSLVVAQFIITIILVTGVIVITSQMSYIKHKDLGYDKNALLFLRVHGNTDVISGYNAFKNELLSNPLVLGAAISNSMPGSFDSGGSETTDEKGDKVQINTARLRVDADYLNVYNLKLVAGRDFDKASSKDTVRPVIINESAVVKLGWNNNETALGKRFTMGNQRGAVIGVVKDFHFSPLQQAIGPLAIYPLGDRFSRITLKTDVSKPTEVIAWVEKTWKKHFPSSLLDYNFLDNAIGDQYRAEERFSKIFSWFSILSLLIACLGLYGLIAYATSQKTKEIGIRKVLGASANGIATMLSKDFLKLVLLAFVIAAPVAGYIMNNWLSDFAYRTNLSWWMFAAAGASVLLIALFTISFQAIKAAIANPVKSLRTE
jgi:putative ABC transport system permease protein